jgi:maleate cis-trans isomerase
MSAMTAQNVFGCIRPSTFQLPSDLQQILPHGVRAAISVLNVRSGRPGEQERALAEVESAVEVLVDEGAQAIAVFGVPISARQGFPEESKIHRRLSETKGVPVLSALAATILELQSRNLKRPLLVTQYSPEINQRIEQYFHDAGLDAFDSVGLSRKNAAEVNATSPDDYYRLAKAVLAERPLADSLFLSARCNLRDVALCLEVETGVHTVYQDQAALWWALRIFAKRNSTDAVSAA